MNVDTANFNLSTIEVDQKKRCYFCDNTGHVKEDCRKYKAF
jgi:hypothetical protein